MQLTKDRNHDCVIISGLSGSGKTFLGKVFCQKHKWTYIDGDWFFNKEKPLVKLSTGQLIKNYDHCDAINWEKLNESVISSLKKNNVVLAFFMPLIDKFTFTIHKHIGLNMGKNEVDMCIQARIITKRLSPVNKKNDSLVVKELVYPMYISMPLPEHIINVVEEGSVRKSKELLLKEMENIVF